MVAAAEIVNQETAIGVARIPIAAIRISRGGINVIVATRVNQMVAAAIVMVAIEGVVVVIVIVVAAAVSAGAIDRGAAAVVVVLIGVIEGRLGAVVVLGVEEEAAVEGKCCFCVDEGEEEEMVIV